MEFEPMLASAGRKVFDNPEWLFELKYDGFRALLIIDGSDIRFKSRRGSDLTKRFAELGSIGKSLKSRSLVLDGEIIAGDGSVASSRKLLHRYAKFGITTLKRKEMVPVKYVAFDVLVVDGRSLVNEPLKARKERLRKLIPKQSGGLMRANYVDGNGTELLAKAASLGFEGIVGKRLDSIYEPGKRSKAWARFKIKDAADSAGQRKMWSQGKKT